MAAKNNTKQLVIATAVCLFGAWRMAGPWLEETDEFKVQLEKADKEVTEIRLEASQFDEGWEKKMKKIETHVGGLLPDKVISSDILDYFLTQFEKINLGKVGFLSVSQSAPSNASLPGVKSTVGGVPRYVRYRFEAVMNQKQVVPYIEHIEQFEGLFHLGDFSYHVDKEVPDTLRMDMNLEFYIAPKEWTLPDKLAKKTKAEEEEEEAEDEEKKQQWHQVFLSAPVKNEARKPAAQMILRRSPKKVPHFDRVVGDSVISEENLYEEGDNIGGWKIIGINPKTKTVTLKSGRTVKNVVVAK